MCQPITEGSAWSDDGFSVIRCDHSLHLDLIAPLASCYFSVGMCGRFLILHPYTALPVVLHCSRADFPRRPGDCSTIPLSLVLSQQCPIYRRFFRGYVDFLIHCSTLYCSNKMGRIIIFANAKEYIILKLQRYALLCCNKSGSITRLFANAKVCVCLHILKQSLLFFC